MTLSIAPNATHDDSVGELARIRAAMARSAVFASLPLHALEHLARCASIRRVREGVVTLSQGELCHELYIIMTGRVKVVIFGDNGREVTLSLLRAGDAFGEVALLDRKPSTASCIADEPALLIVLDREHLLGHMAQFPQTALNLLGEMANRLRCADDNIAQLALCDVQERLVRRLIRLAREEGTEAPEGLLIRRRPTQQALANMIGSCRETISRSFNQLARDGMILSRGRQLVITSALVNRTAAMHAA